MSMRWRTLLFLLILSACDDAPPPEPEVVEAPKIMSLVTAKFEDMPDWKNDDFGTFVPAFEKSCAAIQRKKPDAPFGVLKQAGTNGDWQAICSNFSDTDKSTAELKQFFEAYFQPYAVLEDDNPAGLFTGYYEASLNGSRVQSEQYNVPLYARPDDLVMVDLGQFRKDLKGKRIAGRVKGGRLKPYESREDIVAGKWPHSDQVLVWVDNPVDAFFVQIQGSGIVTLDNGESMRIGYAGQNGHPYYAIGRELIKREALTKANVSMQSIRAWLEGNPAQADKIMNTNKSYVFFRELHGAGPLGAQGVALTAGRSLAVDRTKISYGVPIWVDLEKPVEEASDIRRLMLAQDTGGAIVGAVRGDVFWGYGDIAADMAGKMKSKGRYWVLLPKKRSRTPIP